jgi:N6-L-threonylcarbamoyladenine synthase
MRILAIESSCDETAASVVEDGRIVLSSAIHSQVAEHQQYGGVVPEIASRRHTENICDVVEKALSDANMKLEDVDAIAVTYAPGLIGALLVGVNYAKGLAMAANKPLIPVHHIRGHIAANYLTHPDLKPPFLCLVASGGHSHIIWVEDYTSFKVNIDFLALCCNNPLDNRFTIFVCLLAYNNNIAILRFFIKNTA